MCMIRDALTRDARRGGEEEEHDDDNVNGGTGDGVTHNNNHNGGLREYVMVTALDQEEATSGEVHWHPAEGEAEATAVAMEDDIQFGYLQISSDNSPQSIEEHENGNQVGSGQYLSHSVTAGQPHGVQGPNPGSAVTNGTEVQSRVVTVNGLQFHVYGNVSGLELFNSNPAQVMDLEIPDSEEEEEEERHRIAVEKAIAEANAADTARRTAPISPEHRMQIVNAMKGINLNGYRPTWADSVPEDQWITKIKERGNAG